MQALALIRGLRRLLEREILRTPICVELQNVERVLGLYENIVIQNGLQNRQLSDDVLEKFLTFIEVAQQPFAEGRAAEASRRAPRVENAPRWAPHPEKSKAPHVRDAWQKRAMELPVFARSGGA
jgi:hypothetical protein